MPLTPDSQRGQQAVAGEFAAIIEGDRVLQRGRQPLEDRHERGRGPGRTLAGDLGRQSEPRGPLVQDQNRLGAPAEHQIGLPITELLAILDGFGAVMARATISDRALGCAALAAAAPRLAARQPLPELFELLPRPIDEAINGLRAEPAQSRLVACFQPSIAGGDRSVPERAEVRRPRRPAIGSGDQPSFERSTTNRSSRWSRSSSASRRHRAR